MKNNFGTNLVITALVVFAQLFSLTSIAAIPRKHDFGIESFAPQARAAVQLKEVARVELPKTTQEDIARWVPTNITDNRSEGHTFGRILGRGLTNVLKETKIGEAALRVQKAVAQDISLGGSEDSIQHRIKFRVEAEKAQAKLNYEGFLNAQLSYELSASELKLEVREELDTNAALIVSHTDNLEDRRDTVAFQFKF